MPTTYTKAEKITDTVAAKKLYKPTHPDLFEVFYGEGDYNSKLVSNRAFAKGDIICKIEGVTPGSKTYTSVQVSKNEHIELNSDRKSSFLSHTLLSLFYGYAFALDVHIWLSKRERGN